MSNEISEKDRMSMIQIAVQVKFLGAVSDELHDGISYQ
jgi:hypothetical protein